MTMVATLGAAALATAMASDEQEEDGLGEAFLRT